MPNNILFLRVGIDKGCGGALAPIFDDGRFEYIPIPESPAKVSKRAVRFNELSARSGGTLDQFVPKRYQGQPAHYDPEFETLTYGDPTRNKRGQLLRLQENDYLVFYAGLTPHSFLGEDRLYLIGYFTIKAVHDIPCSEEWPATQFFHLGNNAHFRRDVYDDGLVVVEGKHGNSRLLQKAVPFSDASQVVLPEIANLTGLCGSAMRAIGRWTPKNNVDSVEKWLCNLE